jgi:hypothetical protein
MAQASSILIAGLFRIFGESVLVERLYDLLVKSIMVSLSYALILYFCKKSVSIIAVGMLLLWLLGTSAISGTAVVPVALLNLVAAILLLPAFVRNLSPWRLFLAGGIAGVDTLFRYDTGGALLGIEALALAIAMYLARDTAGARFRAFVLAFLPCIAGFAVVFLPVAGLYLRNAPFADFRYDIITYPATYYYKGRNLPFPRIGLRHFENLECYLPIAIILFAAYVLIFASCRPTASNSRHSFSSSHRLRRGFLIIFAILSLVMYFKGLVRICPMQLYLCITPSLLLLAVLFASRDNLPKPARWIVEGLAALSLVAALWSVLHEVSDRAVNKSSVPAYLLRKARHRMTPEESAWCVRPSPATAGFCFNPGTDRIRAVDYILSRTTPDQRLFEGVSRHDKIFANDNALYFDAQRLPATKWSQFDPGLQNSVEVQSQIIDEFDRTRPPLIVLDSELDEVNEPNASSRSTGVMLLDDYIHAQYRKVETYGILTIWQRVAQ